MTRVVLIWVPHISPFFGEMWELMVLWWET